MRGALVARDLLDASGEVGLRIDKTSDQCGDLICSRVQCEITGVENVNLGVRHIPAIGFRLREVEREVTRTWKAHDCNAKESGDSCAPASI
jgi:hypothetical protein